MLIKFQDSLAEGA